MPVDLSLEEAMELAQRLERDRAELKRKQEEDARRRQEEEKRRSMTRLQLMWHATPKKLVAGVTIWFALWCVVGLYGGASLYFIVSALALMFTVGLGDSRGKFSISTYSVFNEGGAAMLGSLSAEQIEGELRNRRPGASKAPVAPMARPSADDINLQEALKRAKRNDPCPCQSGLKFKKCCAQAAASNHGDSDVD